MLRKIIKKVLNKKGFEVFRKYFYDFNDLSSLGKIFPRDSKITIFDVGANVGQTVKRFKEYWPNSTIYSFEPSGDVFAKLKQNTNDMKDVHVFNFGLGDKNEIKTFHKMSDSGSSSFIPINKESRTYNILHREDNLKYHNQSALKHAGDVTEQCQIKTIDTFCEEKGIRHIDLLKIDVQGYEPHVLKGSASMLGRGSINVILTEIMFTDYYAERRSFSDIESVIKDYNFILHDIPYLARVPTEEEQRLFFVDAIYKNNACLST